MIAWLLCDGLRAAALQNELKAFYEAEAQRRGVASAEPTPTDAENQAARLVVERTGAAGGFGALQPALQRLSAEERPAVEASLRKVPQHMNAELNVLLGQKRSVLEIRDFLSGEFEPLALAVLMENLCVQEKLGLVKFAEKPEEMPPAAPAKKRARPPKKS